MTTVHTDLRDRPAGWDDAPSGVDVRFAKYTSFGNTFLIVDETITPLPNDEERAAFARWALNGDFGVGGTDNVLYVRQADGFVDAGDGSPADFLFRIFEHDGSETLSCGNGLLSTAAALAEVHGGHRWGVLTEWPTGRPRLVSVGVGDEPGTTWVNVGSPRAVPAELYNRDGEVPASGIDEVTGLVVPLPAAAEWARGLPEQIELTGYFNFTGEPHLVLLLGHGVPEVLGDALYVAPERSSAVSGVGLPASPEMLASNLLVDHIGKYVNEHYRSRFPQGVHLNFARLLGPEGPIEYRTYERAIDCETLACGSGAVAMAYVAQHLGLVPGPETELWPHKCRWYQPDARLRVAETPSGFVLTGQPRRVCVGYAARPS